MYKPTDFEYQQLSFIHFNASCGMQLDCENEWFKKSSQLPWKAWEALYAALFPSGIGNVAKPCRMVLGSLIIQLRMGFSDRDLVKQIQENPYYQYFIGLETFQHVPPFVPTLLVEWRKRIEVEFVIKANDALCDVMPKPRRPKKRFGSAKSGVLIATQICDATVAPQNIRFPQDTSLLNEARLKLEAMLDWFCRRYDLAKPRTYRKIAHKEYLAFAKSKKPPKGRIRNAVRQQLGYVRRDLHYLDTFMQDGYAPDRKFVNNIITIHVLYAQQKYMYENDVHQVANRIVSISQPYVRPIVRGKVSKQTEFGAKLHLSVDERGFARIEHLSFDAYNEGALLQNALEAYKYRNHCYPKRVLVDQIYRTQDNIGFCKKNEIRISGPKLGRPSSNEDTNRRIAREMAKDKSDRIEIERYFSVAKRRNGMGLISRKRKDTSLTTIALSVLVTNIFGSFQSAVSEEQEQKTKALKSR